MKKQTNERLVMVFLYCNEASGGRWKACLSMSQTTYDYSYFPLRLLDSGDSIARNPIFNTM